MTKQEYADYRTSVKAFMEREGIDRLYTGHSECPECKVKFDDHDRCPKCGTHVDTWNEPFFSWQSCDCCGDSQGGNREYATGYNPTTEGNPRVHDMRRLRLLCRVRTA